MSLMEMNWRPSDRDLRLFAAVQWIVAAICMWLVYRRFGWIVLPAVLIGLSSIGLIAGLIRPRSLQSLFVAWMLAAFPIGWLMSHVVLAIVYYGVMTPIGFVLRLRGHDALGLAPTRDAQSYWVERPGPSDPSTYFRQF